MNPSQNRAARVIAEVKYEDTDHAKLLKDLDWRNMQEILELDTASLMYKIENDLTPFQLKEMFVRKVTFTDAAPDHLFFVLFMPHVNNLSIGKASFIYRGA